MSLRTTDIGLFIILTTALILLLIGFIILILLLYKRKQLDFGRDLEIQRNEYERKLLSTQLEMQEQTMRHISREIHDNISSLLSMAKMNLRDIGEKDEKNDRQKVSNSLTYVGRAIEDLRYLSKTLNGDYINQFGLENAIAQELDYIARLDIFKTELKLEGTPVFLQDNKNEVMLFRIVQEALNNSMKHARGASRLSVKMQFSAEKLQIIISDDGKIWKESTEKESSKAGIGIKNMEQRTMMLNGEFQIKHTATEGTHVIISVPLEN